ncbi:MAG: hypothetical protein ABEK59_01470 [Halobacteria archaeon]
MKTSSAASVSLAPTPAPGSSPSWMPSVGPLTKPLSGSGDSRSRLFETDCLYVLVGVA